MKYKHVAWESGGDWADACVEYLKVPNSIDLDEAYKRFHATEHQQTRYMSFPMYLRDECGAVDDDKIEVLSDEMMFGALRGP